MRGGQRGEQTTAGVQVNMQCSPPIQFKSLARQTSRKQKKGSFSPGHLRSHQPSLHAG